MYQVYLLHFLAFFPIFFKKKSFLVCMQILMKARLRKCRHSKTWLGFSVLSLWNCNICRWPPFTLVVYRSILAALSLLSHVLILHVSTKAILSSCSHFLPFERNLVICSLAFCGRCRYFNLFSDTFPSVMKFPEKFATTIDRRPVV